MWQVLEVGLLTSGSQVHSLRQLEAVWRRVPAAYLGLGNPVGKLLIIEIHEPHPHLRPDHFNQLLDNTGSRELPSVGLYQPDCNEMVTPVKHLSPRLSFNEDLIYSCEGQAL